MDIKARPATPSDNRILAPKVANAYACTPVLCRRQHELMSLEAPQPAAAGRRRSIQKLSLHNAARDGDTRLLKELIRDGGLEEQDKSGKTGKTAI